MHACTAANLTTCSCEKLADRRTHSLTKFYYCRPRYCIAMELASDIDIVANHSESQSPQFSYAWWSARKSFARRPAWAKSIKRRIGGHRRGQIRPGAAAAQNNLRGLRLDPTCVSIGTTATKSVLNLPANAIILKGGEGGWCQQRCPHPVHSCNDASVMINAPPSFFDETPLVASSVWRGARGNARELPAPVRDMPLIWVRTWCITHPHCRCAIAMHLLRASAGALRLR